MKLRKPRSEPRVTDRIGSVSIEPVVLPSAPGDEPRPKLSLLRVAVATVVLGGAAYGGYVGVRSKVEASAATVQSTWFAPYVDVTLTPTYQFQTAANDPARQTVLGFVVAQARHSCVPSWGGYYGIAQANQALALSSRIAQLQSNGAQAIVSFGGQKNTSLAAACTSATALANAYQQVIDAYHVHTIDLDIEGSSLDSFAAGRRRAAAIRILQQRAARAHQPLNVWLTLPVEPSGLQDNALGVIDSMFRDRVRLAGINVMAMDFSHSPTGGSSMLDLVEESLQSVHAQLQGTLPHYGIHLTASAIWQRLGVTVMIGQNNISGERFTISDAEGLRSYAHAKGIARVSMWSINRDEPCGASYGLAVLSNTCSGTAQSKRGFTNAFTELGGTVGGGAASPHGLLRPSAPDTNPSNAPYPAWNPQASYPAGYKVTEHGEIYQAKWYTSGQDPGAQYQYSWQTPWQLLGPVLPTDHAPVISVPSAATYPAWAATQLYVAGRQVLYEGLPYQAKWPSQGVAPGATAGLQSSSPWMPLYTIPGEPSTAA